MRSAPFLLSLATLMACQSRPSAPPSMPAFEAAHRERHQSPININSQAVQQGHHTIHFGYQGVPGRVQKGHSVKVAVAGDHCLVVDGAHYSLQQYHFHTPSEHLVDGHAFAAELHLVHTRGHHVPTTDTTQYVVVALLFTPGTANAQLAAIEAAAARNDTNAVQVQLRLASWSHDTAHHFWHYEGSLTTPPYTETVSWFVHQQPHTASRAQLARLQKLQGMNARPVQPLNHRAVEVD